MLLNSSDVWNEKKREREKGKEKERGGEIMSLQCLEAFIVKVLSLH